MNKGCALLVLIVLIVRAKKALYIQIVASLSATYGDVKATYGDVKATYGDVINH